MKQYKLIIREDSSNNLQAILSTVAKEGWRLNSYDRNKSSDMNRTHQEKNDLVVILEK